MKLGLSRIYYETYEAAVKRYGYTGKIQDEAISEISKEINLDYKTMTTDRNSPSHLYYQSKFIFDHGNYDANKLLILGFLLCRHTDLEKAGDSFWGLVNPEIKEHVTREHAKAFLN